MTCSAQAAGRHEDSLKQAKRVLKELERWSDDDVDKRQEMLANVHSSLGNAYLETEQYERALEHHKKDYNIANKQYESSRHLHFQVLNLMT